MDEVGHSPLIDPTNSIIIQPRVWSITIMPYVDEEVEVIRMLLEAIGIGFQNLDDAAKRRVWAYVCDRVPVP